MKTTTFDLMKMQAIDLAVCKEFECRICDLVNVADTFQKKVVVFILTHYGYDKRTIGQRYQMTYLYVPTVVAETEHMMKVVLGFKEKINRILNIIDYGENLDFDRSWYFNQAIS